MTHTDRIPKRSRLFFGIWITALFLLLSACAGEKPPEDSSPAPAALSGVFVSESGTLRFNGDGRSIAAEITDDFAAATGLPAGKSEGTYVFLFRNEEWRYDKAETFRIRIGEKNCEFPNMPGQTGENRIVIRADGRTVTFTKQGR